MPDYFVNGIRIREDGAVYTSAAVAGLDDSTDVAKGDALVAVKKQVVGSVATTQHEVNENRPICVKTDFGAVGDGVTDDTAAIQAAIDAANALTYGASIYCPVGKYLCGDLILKSKVRILGENIARPSPADPITTFLGKSGASWVINTPVTTIYNACVSGIHFEGTGSGNAQGGIQLQLARSCHVNYCGFNDFDNQAIKLDAGGTNTFKGNFAQNCLLDRTRASEVGVLQITGSDNWILEGEYTASSSVEGDISDANLYICAVAVLGTSGNNWIIDTVGEISDIGFYIDGSAHKIFGTRSDLNYAHGYRITSDASIYSGCHSYRNGRATDATYNDFDVIAGSSSNTFNGCKGVSSTSDTERCQYAFSDAIASNTAKNFYFGCLGEGMRGKTFDMNATSGGAVTVTQGPSKTFTDADATPSVDNYSFFKWFNPSVFTVTDFDDGVSGQVIHVINQSNSDVTIQDSATIRTSSGVDKALRQSRVYSFANWLGNWYEIGGQPDQVGADVGDAAKTLTPGGDEQTQVWDTAITADRPVILSTTGAWNGAKFRILRTANATGAYNLNVGTGPLKAMGTAGSVCEVEYDGSAWILTAYGTL